MNKHMQLKVFTAIIGSALLAATLSGCEGVQEISDAVSENNAGHTKTVTYPTGASARAEDPALTPEWLPKDASDISQKLRTTGDERIMRFKADLEKITPNCSAIEPGTKPERAPATTANGTQLTYLNAPTMKASWWVSGAELKSTLVCDDSWWLTQDGDWVYAFSPERTNTEIEQASTQ